jgi:putative FmdB family regulatory protein
MPIYEYECGSCGHRFEEWQKMSDKPIKVCPKCKARKVEKLISQTSFQLKGGGWYSDLYASAKPGSGSSSESGAGSATSGSSSGSSSDASGGDTSNSTSTKSDGKGKGKKGSSKKVAA